MPGKVFLDTNVLAYAQDADAKDKRARSREIIAEVGKSAEGVISTQVMQEFYVAATRKLGLLPLAAKAVIKTFDVFEIVQITPLVLHEAIDTSILNKLGFWDALVVAAASAAECRVLYSEDLNHGQTVLGVQIQNPFKR
jgi:predicted nucleic acid-binding protein